MSPASSSSHHFRSDSSGALPGFGIAQPEPDGNAVAPFTRGVDDVGAGRNEPLLFGDDESCSHNVIEGIEDTDDACGVVQQ